MKKIRWWLFCRLSELGWWICPEPHKSNLQAMMNLTDREKFPVDTRHRLCDKGSSTKERRT